MGRVFVLGMGIICLGGGGDWVDMEKFWFIVIVIIYFIEGIVVFFMYLVFFVN